MGMEMMSSAMVPLRSSPEFVNLVTTFENPLIGILVGAGFTAIIQSSSASVGILQALAMSGVITLPSAIYVLFGQNIGTCITAVLASIGTGRNAKRTTIIHLSFNIIGTAGFSSLYVNDFEKEELKYYFPEFELYEGQCRFNGCDHIHEPGCAVKEAVEKGKIHAVRYEDYKELYEELKNKRRY